MHVNFVPVDALALKVTAKPVFEKVKLATGPLPISTVADARWPPTCSRAVTMVSRSVVRKVLASPLPSVTAVVFDRTPASAVKTTGIP